jgi:hypothetical protein
MRGERWVTSGALGDAPLVEGLVLVDEGTPVVEDWVALVLDGVPDALAVVRAVEVVPEAPEDPPQAASSRVAARIRRAVRPAVVRLLRAR